MSPDPNSGTDKPAGDGEAGTDDADTVQAPLTGSVEHVTVGTAPDAGAEADTVETVPPEGAEADTVEAAAAAAPDGEPEAEDEAEPGAEPEDQQAELARLRAEVAGYKATQTAEQEAKKQRRHGGIRWTVSIVLMVLASLLSVVAVVSRYARSQLLDTDRYVGTVKPLAKNPDIQDAITKQVTAEIFSRLDVNDVTTKALDKLVDLGAPAQVTSLAGPISTQVEGFTRTQVHNFVTSDQFPKLWEEANRAAHAQVVTVLTGRHDGAVSVKNGEVSVDLGQIVERVKAQLVAHGFKAADRIPEVHSTFTLFKSDQLTQAQRGTRLLDRSATAMPFVVILLAAGAVFAAPNRRKGLLWVALAIALGMVVLAGGLLVAKEWYLNNGKPQNMTPEAAVGVIRTVLNPLRVAMRAVLALALVVALAAFITGPTGAAKSIREFFVKLRERAQGGIEGTRTPTAVESWVGAHKRALRIGVIVVAVLVLANWTYPSGALVLGIVLVVLIALGLIEVFGWPASRQSTPAAS